jgi:hypothetical protein
MIREYVNEHPSLAVVSVLAAPVLILCIFWHGAAARHSAARALVQGWYTDDDGKSWYADDKWLIPPFDHNGKTAVRAYVFSYKDAGGEHEFVGYMERYAPLAKQALEQAREELKTTKEPPQAGLYERVSATGIELKKPGASAWINVRDPHAAAVRALNCPPGSTVQQVLP